MANIIITINFDMDGTLADLYGVDNWLDKLIQSDTSPYANAEPLLRMSALAKILNRLQREGYRLGIISWLSKSGSEEYNQRVKEVKEKWLAQHLPSVKWDVQHIVPYGTPKETFSNNAWDVLFDDEKRNRDNWIGDAYDVDNILGVLAEM